MTESLRSSILNCIQSKLHKIRHYLVEKKYFLPVFEKDFITVEVTKCVTVSSSYSLIASFSSASVLNTTVFPAYSAIVEGENGITKGENRHKFDELKMTKWRITRSRWDKVMSGQMYEAKKV